MRHSYCQTLIYAALIKASEIEAVLPKDSCGPPDAIDSEGRIIDIKTAHDDFDEPKMTGKVRMSKGEKARRKRERGW